MEWLRFGARRLPRPHWNVNGDPLPSHGDSMSFVDDFVRSWARERCTCELAKWMRWIKKIWVKRSEKRNVLHVWLELKRQMVWCTRRTTNSDRSSHARSVSVVFLFMICSFSHLSVCRWTIAMRLHAGQQPSDTRTQTSRHIKLHYRCAFCSFVFSPYFYIS